MSKPLPPYGRDFQPVPNTGVRVVIGRDTWDYAKNHWHPIIALPDGRHPSEYRWPSDGKPALIHERVDYNDELLDAMAQALLQAGASSVVAIREALLNDYDPRVFYDAEVLDVAA